MNSRLVGPIRVGFAAAILLTASQPVYPGDVYNLSRALWELHSPEALVRPHDPPRRTGVASSADPNGSAFHRGNVNWDDGVERILLDLDGPGVITRIWTDAPAGTLKFRWDGAPAPQWTIPWDFLSEGRLPPFEFPFVESDESTASVNFPLPFSNGMKVTVTPEHRGAWEIHYQVFDPATPVESWWPARGPSAEIATQFTRAERVYLEPRRTDLPGEWIEHVDVVVEPGTEMGWSPDDTILVTAIELKDLMDVVPTRHLHLFVNYADGEKSSAPWWLLTGGTMDEEGTTTFHSGRSGSTGWFQVPFVMTSDDTLGFMWDGDDPGDHVGRLSIRGAPIEGAATEAPRLSLASWSGTLNGENRARVRLPEGNGRLLYMAVSGSDQFDCWFREAPFHLQVDGLPPLVFSGLNGLLGMPHGKWEAQSDGPLNVYKMEFDPAECSLSATTAWWPLGIAHESSVEVTLDGSHHADFGAASLEMALVGQLFGPPLDPPSLPEADVSPKPWDNGSRRVVPGGETRLPFQVETEFPLKATINPSRGWLEAGEQLEGVLNLDIQEDAFRHMYVHLDLPMGWQGTIEDDEGGLVEVRELGWPYSIHEDGVTGGQRTFKWSVIPPADVPWGTYIARLRIVTRHNEDYLHTIMRPIVVETMPGKEPFLVLDEIESLGEDGWEAKLPHDFVAKPGDLVTATFVGGDTMRLHARLHFDPFPENANMHGRDPDMEDVLPPDGESRGIASLSTSPGTAVFPVGRHASWITLAQTLRVSLPAGSDDVRLDSIKIYRRSEPIEPIGWSRQVPYAEWPESHFHVPRYRAMIRGEELFRATKIESAFPGDAVDRVVIGTEFLENVEEGPLRWRIASPPYRTTGFRPAIEVTRFTTDVTGARLSINHPGIRGAQHFGIQFGHGPWSGRVGVRDADGRLMGVWDLAMPWPVNFPQYVWFAAPVPSRETYLLIETMGGAPGGESQHVLIERFMILDGEPE